MSLNIAEQSVTFWGIQEDKGNYAVVKISSSRKDKKTEKYVNSSWYANFVGSAYEKLKELGIPEKTRIKISGATMKKEPYQQDGETLYPKFPTLTVFNFELSDEKVKTKRVEKASDDNFELDNEIPF
jgi:hypothetical protein